MSADEAVAAIRAAVDEGRTPGAVLTAGRRDRTEMTEALGWAETGEHTRPMTVDTLFDLASLTKVVATLPVVLRLLADGRLALDTPVADVLGGFGAGSPWRTEVTVEHLLTHSSGLPPFRTYWQEGLSGSALRSRLSAEAPEEPPGTRVRYSDIGFLDLGWVAEAVTGRGLDELFAEVVASPLGMTRTGYVPRREEDVAATEAAPEGGYRVGTVHDETAASLGVPVGHAGLFAPAADLATYLGAWTATAAGGSTSSPAASSPSPGKDSSPTPSPTSAGGSVSPRSWLPPEWLDAAVEDRTSTLDGHRGLGWTARHDGFDQLGPAWPETAVFHSGFTGTSLALDRPSGRWVVLLTNDVHFGRGRGLMNPLRHAVHTALAP